MQGQVLLDDGQEAPYPHVPQPLVRYTTHQGEISSPRKGYNSYAQARPTVSNVPRLGCLASMDGECHLERF
jgi:hypothetical protein